MSSFSKSTLIITGFTFLGLCLAFLSNLIIAAKFGVGTDMDVYLAATTLPALIILILTTALGSTFIPVFSEYREKNLAEAWKIVSTFINLAAVTSAGLCVVAMIFSVSLTRWMTPGLSRGQIATSADLLRWLLPGIVLTVVNELVSSIYYSNKKFLTPMLIRVLGPLLTIVYVYFFASVLSVRSLVFATLSANAIQTVVLLTGLLRDKAFSYSLSFDYSHPAVKKILRLMLPMVLGMFIYKLAPAFERWLASGMPTGSISVLGYATRLSNVIHPILVSGISISGFTLMADFVSKGDLEGLKGALSRSFNILLFTSVPLAVLLCGFGKPLIALLFERGAFTHQDTLRTYGLFAVYVLALPATALGTVIGQGFYIFQDTRIPTLSGFAEIVVYVLLCLLLIPHFGLMAFPISFNAYYYLTILVLGLLLARKTGFSVLSLFVRPLLTSTGASLLSLGLGLGLALMLPKTNTCAVACLGAALAAYFAIQKYAFRSREADRLVELVLRRLPMRRAQARLRA